MDEKSPNTKKTDRIKKIIIISLSVAVAALVTIQVVRMVEWTQEGSDQKLSDFEELTLILEIVDTGQRLDQALMDNNLEEARAELTKLKELRENLPNDTKELRDLIEIIKTVERDALWLIKAKEKKRQRENSSP